MCALMLLGLYGKVAGTGCELLGWCDQCADPDIRQQRMLCNGPLVRYVKLRVAHAPGMPETFSPPPWVSDPDKHHGTCVTHVSWCMRVSLTSGFLWSRWRGNVPGIPGACTTRNFRYLVRGPQGKSSLLFRPLNLNTLFIKFVLCVSCVLVNYIALVVVWCASNQIDQNVYVGGLVLRELDCVDLYIFHFLRARF